MSFSLLHLLAFIKTTNALLFFILLFLKLKNDQLLLFIGKIIGIYFSLSKSPIKRKPFLAKFLFCKCNLNQVKVKFLKINYLGVTSSGSAAINLAYLILELKPGDEIVVPGFGFLAAANVAQTLGLKVIFADVDPNTFCVNVDTIKKVLSKKTKLILIIHTYGNMCNMNEIVSLAKRKKIYLMEDAAQALGSKYNGKHAGTIGDIGVFSFTSTKTLTTGEGGAICVKKKSLYDKLILFRSYGYIKKRYYCVVPGHNLRMSNLLASIGFSQMSRLNSILKKK